ncbi:hypothetical protein BGZ73_001426, partial [Actinomortierella ambigua]
MPKISFDLSASTPQVTSVDTTVSLMSFTVAPSFPITQAKINLAIMDAGIKTSSFAVGKFPVKATGYKLEFDIPTTPLTVNADEQASFINLVSALVTKDSY